MPNTIYSVPVANQRSSASDTCVVVLCCKDHESLDVVLASIATHTPAGVPVFMVQNCFGSFDNTKTRAAAQRYTEWFPGRFILVDWLGQNLPYVTIAKLLRSEEFGAFKYVCKIDDDCFPVVPDWLDRLKARYVAEKGERGGQLAYVTPLINNNCWGFGEIVDVFGWADDYRRDFPRATLAGLDTPPHDHVRVVPPGVIDRGGGGTIWRYPEVARWLHERTTFDLDRYIAGVQGLAPAEVDASARYSIGCIFFEPALYDEIAGGGGLDDEHLFHVYCKRHRKAIVCERSVPMVHLYYFTHRVANRDLGPRVRTLMVERLRTPLLRETPATEPFYELSERLRTLEAKLDAVAAPLHGFTSVSRRARRAWTGVLGAGRALRARLAGLLKSRSPPAVDEQESR